MGVKVTKWTIAADGSVWALQADGMLLVNGGLKVQHTRDFALARGGTLYWLGDAGTLQRFAPGSTQPELLHTDVSSIFVQSDGMISYVSALRQASVPVLNSTRNAIAYYRRDVVINPYKWAE